MVIDPERPDLEQFPDYSHSSVYRVRLEAGDCLYLPSCSRYSALDPLPHAAP